jgi:hypothetical protein
MRFTLTWLPAAESALAEIWGQTVTQGKDAAAITLASDRIEKSLRSSSVARGNDVAGVYHMTVWPLRVVFDVSPDDRMVTIRQVTYVG